MLADRRLEKRRLAGRVLGEQPLDVVLEGIERRLTRRGFLRRQGLMRHTPRQPLENREQLGERSAFGDLRLQAAGIDANAVRGHRKLLVLDTEAPDDHLACAHKLRHLDDRRAAQRGCRWEVQLLKGADPLGSDQRRRATLAQAVGHQHRRRFRQPLIPGLVGAVFERHDEDTVCRGLSERRRNGGQDRERKEQKVSAHVETRAEPG